MRIPIKTVQIKMLGAIMAGSYPLQPPIVLGTHFIFAVWWILICGLNPILYLAMNKYVNAI